MQDEGESPLPGFILENGDHVVISGAGMNDQRQAGLAGDGDVVAEALSLGVAGRGIVVVIEPGFTDGDTFWMLGQSDDFFDAYVEFFMRIVRMGPD